MSKFTSAVTVQVVPEGTTRTYQASNSVTDDLLHAYVQEFQLTTEENEVVMDIADDPNYADFVLFRVEVVDWGQFTSALRVKVTSGSDSAYFVVRKQMPVFEMYGVDMYTDNSNGGSADTVDEISLIGAGDGLVSGISNPIYVRVTAYTVAS